MLQIILFYLLPLPESYASFVFVVAVDLLLQPRQINFQEHDDSESALTASSNFEDEEVTCLEETDVIYSFIRTVLEASGMTCCGVLERRGACNQILSPSLLEEVGISCSLLPGDSELLFDCINEVLWEIHGKLFNLTSWVYLIKPGVQVILPGADLIEEVCKSIDRHIEPSQFPLDDIVTKDIESRSWVDFRCEIEAVIADIADKTLEEIIEETM